MKEQRSHVPQVAEAPPASWREALLSKLTISVQEAGQLLGISRGLAYQAAHDGVIPTIRVGARRLIVPVPRFLAELGATIDQLETPEPDRRPPL